MIFKLYSLKLGKYFYRKSIRLFEKASFKKSFLLFFLSKLYFKLSDKLISYSLK